MEVSYGSQPRSEKGKKIREQIPYQCDNCGVNIIAYGSVPRCLGCGKALCEICNTFLLCPQDFHNLNQKDQRKIKKIRKGMENVKSSKIMFTAMPIILGAIGLVLLLLMLILKQDIFYFLFGFLGGFLLLSSLMIFCTFYNFEERETKRITMQVKDILTPYNIKRTIVGQNKQNIQARNEEDVVFCPSCGEKMIGSYIKTCKLCGESLKY